MRSLRGSWPVVVSGVTIVKNAIRFAYPVVESITSILPLCSEFLVGVGDSDDGTLELIRSMVSPKIRIIESRWDDRIRQGGLVLAQQTNRVLARCQGDWIFYLQADEVLHEKYLDRVQEAMQHHLPEERCQGLTFRYLHFYGSYRTVQDNRRRWYRRRTRIIRHDQRIRSWGDAMDFKLADGKELETRSSGAWIYHYGWVRPPGAMVAKRVTFEGMYRTREDWRRWRDSELPITSQGDLALTDLGHLVRFRGTHPQVMAERIRQENWEFDPHWESQLPSPLRQASIFFWPLTRRVRRLSRRLRWGADASPRA